MKMDVDRLKGDVIHCLTQFHRYTAAHEIDRNKMICEVLEELLFISEKAQREHIEWIRQESKNNNDSQ